MIYKLISLLLIDYLFTDYLRSGLCFCFINGKTDEKNIFRTIKNRRNGGNY
jgi:hypothetical protein